MWARSGPRAAVQRCPYAKKTEHRSRDRGRPGDRFSRRLRCQRESSCGHAGERSASDEASGHYRALHGPGLRPELDNRIEGWRGTQAGCTDKRIPTEKSASSSQSCPTRGAMRLAEAETAWFAYRQADSRSQGDIYEGGSESSVASSHARSTTTRSEVPTCMGSSWVFNRAESRSRIPLAKSRTGAGQAA